MERAISDGFSMISHPYFVWMISKGEKIEEKLKQRRSTFLGGVRINILKILLPLYITHNSIKILLFCILEQFLLVNF